MSTDTTIDNPGTAALHRIAPLAGVLFAGLSIAGDFTIGPFPDGSTPATGLRAFYAAHGSHVALGGTLLGLGGVFFAIFAAAVWARLRGAAVPAVISGVVLLGAAVDTMADLSSGAGYNLLGGIGADPNVTPEALQALQINGAEFGVGGGAALFLFGVAAAGIAYRAVPRWLAWTGLVLGLAQFAPSPYGFFASMILLLWVAVAGVALAVRPDPAPARAPAVPQPVG
ncbi:MAG: hypothetical protein QOJ68_3518 [Blastococcus sp.]|jgi:hypothetical protein|nr:hypothetical protein [Blastococcus sp.]